jgi:hypothetical protein
LGVLMQNATGRDPARFINGMYFPPGYPMTFEGGRAISKCRKCGTPLRMPNLKKVGELVKTPFSKHKPNCPQRDKAK